jgi:hypothetical protein
MANIIVMVHSEANKNLYTALFGRMKDVSSIVIPVDSADINAHKEQIDEGLRTLGISKKDVDYILLSTNYGHRASEEINKPAFEYFLKEFENATMIGTGTTLQSIAKALDLSDRIFAMKHSLNETEILSLPLSNKLISVKTFKDLIEETNLQKNVSKKMTIKP